MIDGPRLRKGRGFLFVANCEKTPIISPLLAVLTFLTSTGVAYFTSGQPFATVSTRVLLHAGWAIDDELLRHGDVWRLVTSQLVHVRQLHMLFNVSLCLVLGNAFEQTVGRLPFLLVYWIGGSLGILASIEFLRGDVGSGSSQALMAICSALIVLKIAGSSRVSDQMTKLACAASLIQLGLDIYAVRYPKPGHVAGFAAGTLLALVIRSTSKAARPEKPRAIVADLY